MAAGKDGQQRRYDSVVIVGSGVFGLTTALHLAHLPPAQRPHAITVIDKSVFPAPDAASIDSSRIIRADYKDALYAELCRAAQVHWRGGRGLWEGLGGGGRYTESGLVLVADCDGKDGALVEGMGGAEYVRRSMENVVRLEREEGEGEGRNGVGGGGKVKGMLYGRDKIAEVCGTGGGALGEMGYLNMGSGWADAEAAMAFVRRRCEESGRVEFVVGEVVKLDEVVYESGIGGQKEKKGTKVKGVVLRDGRTFHADLTVLAMGAWTAGLVDLRGRAVSTGQVIGYLAVSPEEEKALKDMPVVLNLSTGLFVLPPRNGVLKVARHSVGYVNPVPVQYTPDTPGAPATLVSLPLTAYTSPANLRLPKEAHYALRSALRELLPPSIAEREFTSTRICWYTDTPTGDFIVSHIPGREGLFLATGGSGHAFKFLPVLGGEVTRVIMDVDGDGGGEVGRRWRWKGDEEVVENVVTLDGSRGVSVQCELRVLLDEEEEGSKGEGASVVKEVGGLDGKLRKTVGGGEWGYQSKVVRCFSACGW